MTIIRYYRRVETPHSLVPSINERLHHHFSAANGRAGAAAAVAVVSIEGEYCFNVQMNDHLPPSSGDGDAASRLEWLLRETFDPDGLRLESSAFATDAFDAAAAADEDDDDELRRRHRRRDDSDAMIVEFGPRKTFTSAFSSNATSICAACGLSNITRLERSRRYRITTTHPPSSSSSFSSSKDEDEDGIAMSTEIIKSLLHDRMTEEEYHEPVTSFDSGVAVVPVMTVPIMEEGREALMRINDERGLGFDDFDLHFYTDLFKVKSS